MSDGITDDNKLKQDVLYAWRKKAIEEALPVIPTSCLVDELCKRTGCFEYVVQPDGMYSLHVMSKGHDHIATNCGSYRILVVKI